MTDTDDLIQRLRINPFGQGPLLTEAADRLAELEAEAKENAADYESMLMSIKSLERMVAERDAEIARLKEVLSKELLKELHFIKRSQELEYEIARLLEGTPDIGLIRVVLETAMEATITVAGHEEPVDYRCHDALQAIDRLAAEQARLKAQLAALAVVEEEWIKLATEALTKTAYAAKGFKAGWRELAPAVLSAVAPVIRSAAMEEAATICDKKEAEAAEAYLKAETVKIALICSSERSTACRLAAAIRSAAGLREDS